jgi:opacity protein-like surface antigen
MIRKFATIPVLGLFQSAIFVFFLSGVAAVHAQQTPPQQPAPQSQTQQQQPADQSSSQETSEEETPRSRRKKPPNYKKWSFNVGGGANLPAGTTNTYVRGGGGVAAAGVARNYSKYFGLRLDVQFNNLPLRTSALELAQAPGANNHVFAVMLDPIFNVPVTNKWGGYIVVGPSYFHRSGKLDSSTAIPGSACDGFFTWWGRCYAGSLPIDGNFLHSSLNQFGVNFGGGITRKIRPNMDFYLEFRYLHGKNNNITTDSRPITAGIRW